MRGARIAVICTMLLALPVAGEASDKLTTLYRFKGYPDGQNPSGPIATDKSGDLFGTTETGGATNLGTVFEVSPPASGQTSWTEKILWDFDKKQGAYFPQYGLVSDRRGDLYGTTPGYARNECGTVFRVFQGAGGRHAQILWKFGGSTVNDGCHPSTALIVGANRVLYGVTTGAGNPNNQGTVFSVTPPSDGSGKWTETILAQLANSGVGAYTNAQLVRDGAGNLYGTSQGETGIASIWELSPPTGGLTDWTLKQLWTLPKNFGFPSNGPLALDASGALYGTAGGGKYNAGIVYKLAPPRDGGTTWTATILWSIVGGSGGGNPTSGPVFAPDGGLIVPTLQYNSQGYETNSEILKLMPPAGSGTRWVPQLLWDFDGDANGIDSELPPLARSDGRVFGTTFMDSGVGFGTVWELTP
jgi:uncharacterized repeat protein (TIGR03803 family)